MSNWLFPDQDASGAEAAGAAADPDLDPEEADVDPDAVDVDPLDASAVEPGTSVLVVGPPMTGKRRLLFDLVGGSESRTAAFVTTKKPADRMRAWFEATRPDGEAWDLSFVDCSGSRGGLGSDGAAVADLRTVSSPGDLTGIGIELTGILRGWHHDSVADPRVGLHSLSTLLMYADVKRIYQFLHVVTTRIATVDGVGVFTMDVSPRGDTADEITHLFDALVQVRDSADGPEFRVRGRDFGPRKWTEF